jgi:hypothetical protein
LRLIPIGNRPGALICQAKKKNKNKTEKKSRDRGKDEGGEASKEFGAEFYKFVLFLEHTFLVLQLWCCVAFRNTSLCNPTEN